MAKIQQGYLIKENPEDFVVEEITNMEVKSSGAYVYFWLKKKGLNTLQAIEYLAKDLRLHPKFLNFAGTKDKNAITTQLISIKGKNREQVERINIKDIELKFYGYADDRLHLGDLIGNRFTIKVSNVDVSKLNNVPKNFVNYFGVQRLSEYNAPIGKAIVKQRFDIAVELMKKANPFYARKMEEYLVGKKNDYVSALKLMPKKLLKLYVNSYQSHMWNETVRLYFDSVDGDVPQQKIPMIGFGTEFENTDLKRIVTKIMKIEELSLRDFIIRKLPDLSAEGDARNLYLDIKDFKVVEKGKDWVVLSFELGKGSYATEVIRQIFG